MTNRITISQVGAYDLKKIEQLLNENVSRLHVAYVGCTNHWDLTISYLFLGGKRHYQKSGLPQIHIADHGEALLTFCYKDGTSETFNVDNTQLA